MDPVRHPLSLIDQWDADALTSLINDLIISKLKEITEIFPVTYNFWDRFKIDSIVQFLITFSSLQVHSCLPGQKLINFSMHRGKYTALTSWDCLKYASFEFLINVLQEPSWNRVNLKKVVETYQKQGIFTRELYSAFRWISATLIRLCVLLNEVAFLASAGKFKRLPERLLNMETTSLAAGSSQMRSNFVPREVLWKLSFGVIYVTITTLMRLQWFYRMFRRIEGSIRRPLVGKEPKERANGSCGVCGLHPTMPCKVKPCGHVYCYFCIHQKLKTESTNSFCTRRNCDVKVVKFDFV